MYNRVTLEQVDCSHTDPGESVTTVFGRAGKMRALK